MFNQSITLATKSDGTTNSRSLALIDGPTNGKTTRRVYIDGMPFDMIVSSQTTTENAAAGGTVRTVVRLQQVLQNPTSAVESTGYVQLILGVPSDAAVWGDGQTILTLASMLINFLYSSDDGSNTTSVSGGVVDFVGQIEGVLARLIAGEP